MVKEGLGIGLLGNYVMPDPELVPLDLDVRIDLPMHLLVESERLQARPVRIVYDWLCTVFSQTNYWLSSEFDPAGEIQGAFGKTLSRALLTDWTQGSPS